MKRWIFHSTTVAGGILMIAIPVTAFRIWWAIEDNRRAWKVFGKVFGKMYGPDRAD